MEFKLITYRYVANVITHWATFFGKGKQYNFFSYFIGVFSKGVRHYIEVSQFFLEMFKVMFVFFSILKNGARLVIPTHWSCELLD